MDLSSYQRKKFIHNVVVVDGIIHHCLSQVKMLSVLEPCDMSPVCGHHYVFRLRIRFCNVNTIGQPYTKTLMISSSLVIVAKERVGFQRGKSSQ